MTTTELSRKLGTCAWLCHSELQHPAPGGRAAVTWGPQGLGVLHSPCSGVQVTGADSRSPAPLPGVRGQCASPGFPMFPAKSRGKAQGRQELAGGVPGLRGLRFLRPWPDRAELRAALGPRRQLGSRLSLRMPACLLWVLPEASPIDLFLGDPLPPTVEKRWLPAGLANPGRGPVVSRPPAPPTLTPGVESFALKG